MNTIKGLRESRLLTQAELASSAGISVSNLSRLENNKQRPEFRTLKKLAKALKVKPEDVQFQKE